MTIRDLLLERAPRWLRGHWGGRLLSAFGLGLDQSVEAARAVVWSSWPGHRMAARDALTEQGRDLMLPRYPADTDATYRARLRRAWELHRRAGTIERILEELTFAGLPGCTITRGKPGDPGYSTWFVVTLPWASGHRLGVTGSWDGGATWDGSLYWDAGRTGVDAMVVELVNRLKPVMWAYQLDFINAEGTVTTIVPTE